MRSRDLKPGVGVIIRHYAYPADRVAAVVVGATGDALTVVDEWGWPRRYLRIWGHSVPVWRVTDSDGTVPPDAVDTYFIAQRPAPAARAFTEDDYWQQRLDAARGK